MKDKLLVSKDTLLTLWALASNHIPLECLCEQVKADLGFDKCWACAVADSVKELHDILITKQEKAS